MKRLRCAERNSLNIKAEQTEGFVLNIEVEERDGEFVRSELTMVYNSDGLNVASSYDIVQW